MINRPSPPYFSISYNYLDWARNEQDDFYTLREKEGDEDMTIFGYMYLISGKFNFWVYDNNGLIWVKEYEVLPFKISFWQKILAYTFYNPKFKIKFTWKIIKDNYFLKDLKSAIYKVIDQDDDIYTQFIEHEDLKKLVSQATNLQDLIFAMETMPDDENT